MPSSRDITMYNDVRAYADQALSAERGIRITFETRNAATAFRQRFYAFRLLARAEALKLYDASSPEYGIGPYDNLQGSILPTVDGFAFDLRKTYPPKVIEL